MIAVNDLIQDAYESIGMTGIGEAAGDYAEDNMPVVACKELNRLISNLNNEGYIAMAQKWVDCPNAKVIYFRKLYDGEEANYATVDMEPPQKIESVARQIGNRFILLNNSNVIQQSQVNPYTTAMTWTYDTDIEDVHNENDNTDTCRIVGILRLDGEPHNTVRAWYNSQLPTYKLDEKIYLSDLYRELLLSGLSNRLANYFELSDEKKASTASDFLSAKTLIKRSNATQRMQQCAEVGTDWRTNFVNGYNGVGM
jgi:hypothetical protein